MAIEIGSLVVRGTFGQPAKSGDGLTEEQVQEMVDRLRRDMREVISNQIAAVEQRIREG
ncbi:hypothetical protein [Yoonia sediminilitoris]|uniref:Uncharacterized protein n=1 Tax=Yoonia sediminilitoris TaxID=1286148 RepID=A0A2T6KME2_9RHOB|nr:hypothetical protein [Yoonia sediminilitoris]PUB17380.1 hypothetical protein C8N45_102392 [Yoonia sediminilitoris]RCW97675.1 hypothetical protein DFP92_102392 [Yoonia sediminilitoris]